MSTKRTRGARAHSRKPNTSDTQLPARRTKGADKPAHFREESPASGDAKGSRSAKRSKESQGAQPQGAHDSRFAQPQDTHDSRLAQSQGARGSRFARNSHYSQDLEDRTSNKKRLRNRIIIAAAAVVVLGVAAALIWAASLVSSIDTKIRLDSAVQADLKEVLAPVPENPDEPYYVLIIGSDSRDPDDASVGLADTIMLARVDPATPLVTILSIPRDTEIQLEDYGSQKINASFTYYGESGVVKAVSDLCGVPITHYAEIDFNGVIALVDILGGIEVNVPVDIDLDGVFIPAGLQYLDGTHALIMSRCRSFPTGDFRRVVNQRILLQAVASKILHSNPLEIPGLIEELADCVKTDLSALDAIDLVMKLRGMDTATSFYMDTVPSTNNYHDETSYVWVDPEQLAVMMERVNQGLSPREEGTAPLTPDTIGSQ